MVTVIANKRGQTSIEYLLLLAATFFTAFLMVKGPLSGFTESFVNGTRIALKNYVQTAEYETEEIQVGSQQHPSSSQRFKAVHFE